MLGVNSPLPSEPSPAPVRYMVSGLWKVV